MIVGDFPYRERGWQCPICGRVYSPSTPMCFCCQEGTPNTVTTDRTMPVGEPLRYHTVANTESVVRCMDCKHWSAIESEENDCDMYGICDHCNMLKIYDWFCADGEREDGDGNVLQ